MPFWFPTAPWFGGNWYISVVISEDNKPDAPTESDGIVNWSTDIVAWEPIKVHDDFSMAKRNIDNMLDLAECDIDCQAKGSRLSLVATLNEASLTLLVINGLLGIWGGWSAIGRISQTYCTFLTFFFQLAILISCATMLFTPYAKTCYASLFPTTSVG